LRLERGVGKTEPVAHPFRPPALEPLERAGVVESSHLVRFAVADTQIQNVRGLARCGFMRRRRLRGHFCFGIAFAYFAYFMLIYSRPNSSKIWVLTGLTGQAGCFATKNPARQAATKASPKSEADWLILTMIN